MAAQQQTGNSRHHLWTICLVLLLLGTFVLTAQADARRTDNPLATQGTGTSPATESSQATATPSPTEGTAAATINATSTPTDTASAIPVSPTATDRPPTDTSVPTSTSVPPTATEIPPTTTIVPTVTDLPPTITQIATASGIAPTTMPGTLLPSATAPVSITSTAKSSPTVEPPTGIPLRPTASATAVIVTPLPSVTAMPTDAVTTIGIETLGPSATASPGASVTVAPIVALPVLIESDNSVVQRTGQWTVQNSAQASGGDYLYSNGGTADSLRLSFQGDALDILYVKHPALGVFAVEIDGQTVLTVTATAAVNNVQAWAEIRNLTAGPHIARVFPIGGMIAIDAFAIELPVVLVIDPTGTATLIPSSTPTNQPSPTAPSTSSPTFTSTSVPPSPTATSTPTKLPVLRLTGQVSGLVSLLPARITVVGGRSQQSITASTDGSFSLELPPGSYQITVATLYHLPYIGEVVMADQPVVMPTITLIAGDINGDGVINATDAQLIADNFGRAVPPAPLAVDINGDGIINIYDLAILSANMKPH